MEIRSRRSPVLDPLGLAGSLLPWRLRPASLLAWPRPSVASHRQGLSSLAARWVASSPARCRQGVAARWRSPSSFRPELVGANRNWPAAVLVRRNLQSIGRIWPPTAATGLCVSNRRYSALCL
jgi:hypothetical protein